MRKNNYDYYFSALAILLPPLIFAALFQIWNVDLTQLMFKYNADDFITAFTIKTVINTGWFSSNDMVSFPHITEKFYFHDFPLHADFLNFVIIKIFAYFSSDPFFILNGVFILTLSLVSLTSFIVLRHFKITNFTALIISVLFAFTPYHLYRNTLHLFLSNYMMIPFIIMVSLWISSDKIKVFGINKKGQFSFDFNRYFFIAFLICLMASATGIYYALYSCIVFAISYIISLLINSKDKNQTLSATFLLCLTILIALLLLNIPSILYWFKNGANILVVGRDTEHSYIFSLKIASLFAPIENHYIKYFADLGKTFDSLASEIETPAERLGLLGSIALLFLLIWPFAKNFPEEKNSFFIRTIHKFNLTKSDQNLISKLSFINLFIILFATVGGLITFIVIPFPFLRSNARFSIFIAFIALFLIAIIFDKIIENKIFNSKLISKLLVLTITLIALFDQVGKVSAASIQTVEMKQQFNNDRDFIRLIENKIPQGSMIFELPALTFPEGGEYRPVIGYLFSKNLRWSFPAMKGRSSSNWQQNVVNLDFNDFISELKKAGFNGVYLDRELFININSAKKETNSDLSNILKDLRILENNLKTVAKNPPLISENKKLIFFEI
ncbi:MAG: hypothetical protein KGQ36_05775 [Rickettsiales bacterium]|nr:hypothetical protein [Rickettsiales bacterium]